MNLSNIVRRLAVSSLITVKALGSPVALGACAIAQRGDGRVLLVRHRYQWGWMLPGGGVARGEPPEQAIVRELREEVGMTASSAPEFLALFTRKAGWATNVVALYRVTGAEIDFKPNLEVHAIVWADPASLPAGTTAATARRLAEVFSGAPRSAFW